MITKKGIGASPGIAIGPALVLDAEEYRIPRRTVDPALVAEQLELLDHALRAARQEVVELRLAARRRLGEDSAQIFAFHEAFIADPTLRENVRRAIRENHYSAAYGFAREMNLRQRQFRRLTDPYLRERVRDLYDIERRVLRHILGREREDVTRLTEPVILVAHDITPSQAVALDREHILAFAVNVGGPTSHMAIIARMRGIPCVVGLADITSDVSGGETMIVDGRHGIVVINPDDETVQRYRERARHDRQFAERLDELRSQPAVTQDGTPVTLLANIEFPEEVSYAMQVGAEGVGLYRTEFLFMASARLPTEEEQYEAFRDAVRRADGKPVTIRTIDLGADKLQPGATSGHDANPVLGLRSIRYCLQNLDLFKVHLRAILRASVEGDVRIMFPMITTLMELRQARATLADVMEDLDEDGIPYRRDIPVGIMVETPAAAMLCRYFAREVDFLSIGTNDLTQYTLAVDRANERVAHLFAPHNPAVVRLIREVIAAGRRAGTTVNVCGEMAGTPLYCELLIGLGLRQLSMAPHNILEIKKIVRSTTIDRCTAIARKVLRYDAERQIANFLRDKLREIEPEGI